jgi:antitoxin HicB
MFNYPVTIEQDLETKQFMVEFVDIQAVYSMGESVDDALLNAVDALETAFYYLMQERKPIPLASSLNGRPAVALPVLVAGKVALYSAMLSTGMRKSDLARKLNIAPSLVDRLLSLKHKSRIEQIETALALLGRRLLVDVD